MTQTKLLAFHGDPAIKAKYVSRLRAHHAQDQIVQGFYCVGDPEKGTFRGCAVGCTLNGSDHSAYPDEIGYPTVLAHLEDSIFEGLPASEAPQFAVDFLDVVAPRADLSLVWPHFALWMLSDKKHGVLRLANEGTRPSIEGVIALFRRVVEGEVVHGYEWQNAASFASATAYATARREDTAANLAFTAHATAFSSVYAYADFAAPASAHAATADAAFAAYATAHFAEDTAAAVARARSAYARSRQRQASQLLQFLRTAPVCLEF